MIWCVEDDPSIRDIEIYALQIAGLETKGFESGNLFWEEIHKEHPDLVLMDVMLPGIDGVELLRRMKTSVGLREIPVIMATAKGAEYDKIQSLDLGADDYLVKPFSMMEMVSRVKAVLRRCQPHGQKHLLKLDNLEMNLNEHTLTIDNKRIILTYKEFELLRLFLTSPGKAFTREQLLSAVWNQDYLGDSRTVDMHIRTLRQKLGNWGERIETVRNVGYRLETHYGS